MAEFIESFNTYWPGFCVDTYDENEQPVPEESVAYAVIQACGIEHDVEPTQGGLLTGIDIKNMDAAAALKMSLMESFAKGSEFLLEPVVDEYGKVKFVNVGGFDGDLSDVYHVIRTSNYITYESVVKITGKKPRPVRRVGTPVTLTDPVEYNARVWDTSYMATGCALKNIKKHATITFKDPHKEYTNSTDGVASIYEAEFPWEKVIGWMYYLDPGLDRLTHPSASLSDLYKNVKVYLKSQSTLPILVSASDSLTGAPEPFPAVMPDMGVLIRRETIDSLYNQCIEGIGTEVICDENAVSLVIPDNLRYEILRGVQVDKFIGVSRLYVVGQELSMCGPYPKANALNNVTAANNPENWDLWIGMNDINPRYINLDEGTDYGISVTVNGDICIKFADNSNMLDVVTYGKNTPYKVVSSSPYFRYNHTTNTIELEHQNTNGWGTIFPRDNRTGILVQQIWAQVDLDTPCLVVMDPYGYADLVAQQVVLQMAPIIMREEAAPIAIDGTLLDLTEVFRTQDADPTTIQDFENTEYEQLLASMDGKQVVELNMATLNATETQELSQKIKNIIEADREKDINISYICGPTAEPQLGGLGQEGGIINNISYNYSDGGSYTISVREGPYIVPSSLSGITGDYYNKATETLSQAQGRVIQDYGNNILFKVLVDGFGVVRAVCGTAKQIIREGDKVSLTIHNVPVES